MLNLSKWVAVLLIFVCTTAVSAETGKQRLLRFFAEVKSLQADFTQQMQSKDFAEIEKSTGTLQMQRPGRFRWDYKIPFEQQLIADGKNLWIYDVELEQVMVQPLEKVLGNTPAGLLSGDAKVSDRFIIRDIDPMDEARELTWIELTPKDAEASFQVLLMAFGKDLDQLLLTDSFGQKTKIVLSNLVRNPVIDPAVFNFIPPPGVDVLGESE
ncbi:MAG: outer membrane lipoprotein chaperone LolA [Thiohalomonadales bacterium]